jgi:hypothetical protein
MEMPGEDRAVLPGIAAAAGAGGVRVDTAVPSAPAAMKAEFDPSASGSHLASMLAGLMNSRRTEIARLRSRR